MSKNLIKWLGIEALNIMLHAPAFLSLSHELLREKFPWKILPGMRIARGFADVGFEEYSVLTERSMVSLSTGQKGEIPESYRDHFFPIFTPDEISSALYELGVDIVSLEFVNQRTWRGKFTNGGADRVIEGKTLNETLLRTLLSGIRREFNV